jgi:hypothetical protein
MVPAYQQKRLNPQGSMEFIWKNAGKLAVIALAAQLMVTQVLGANITNSEPFSQPRLADAAILSTASFIPISLSQSEIQKVLVQFDRVNTDLQRITDWFNTNTNRNFRKFGPYFTTRPTCNISLNKLNELKKTVDNQLSNAKVPQTDKSQCDYSSSSADNCNAVVKLIQCGINKLQIKFKTSNEQNVPLSEYVALQNAHNELIRELASMKDDLERSISQEFKQIIEELESSNQELTNSLNFYLKSLQDVRTQFCISEIHHGKIDRAFTIFNDLRDDNLLAYIVEASYSFLGGAISNGNNEKKLENFDNIVNFIGKFPLISHKAVGYAALYKMMRIYNHIKNRVQMFTLSDLVNEQMDKPDYLNLSQENKNKFLSMKDCADTIVADWAAKIRRSQRKEILDILINYKGDCGAFVNNFWGQIIKESYESINYATTVISFMNELPCIFSIARFMNALYEEMKKRRHLDSSPFLTLVFALKKKSDYANTVAEGSTYGKDGRQYVRNTFDNIKNQLPDAIRMLFWDGSIGIRLRRNSQCALDGNSKGSIYTYVKNSSKNQIWDVKVADSGKYFLFQNRETKRYLYAEHHDVSGKVDEGRYDPYRCYWALHPIENGTYFVFKSRNTNWNLDSQHPFNHCSGVRASCSPDSPTDYPQWFIVGQNSY